MFEKTESSRGRKESGREMIRVGKIDPAGKCSSRENISIRNKKSSGGPLDLRVFIRQI
jgi:hypothetical protein